MRQFITFSLVACLAFIFNNRKTKQLLPLSDNLQRNIQLKNAILQQHGIATYYHNKYNGSPTANQEKLDITAFTCAHLTYPFGTLLKVTSTVNQKIIIVRVNDRGPSNKKYCISLTFAGAQAIGMDKTGGQMEVDIEPIIDKTTPLGIYDNSPPATSSFLQDTKETPAQTTARTAAKAATGLHKLGSTPPSVIVNKTTDDITDPTNPAIVFPTISSEETTTAEDIAQQDPPTETPATTPTNEPIAPPIKTTIAPKTDDTIVLAAVTYSRKIIVAKGFAVQFGAMADYEKAMDIVQNLGESGIKEVSITKKCTKTGNLYKVLVGPLLDENTAFIYQDRCRKSKIDCYVINLETMELIKDTRASATSPAIMTKKANTKKK